MKLEVPRELGDIVESCEFPDSKQNVIIVPSGMFESYDTERAIAFLLEYLVVKDGLNLAMLGDRKKGGYVDQSILMTIPKHTNREDTANYAMRKGHIGGAEHLAITSEGAIAVYGVERRLLFAKIMAAQMTGKPIGDLMEQRQASIVEETLRYMESEGKELAALTVKDFDLDKIKGFFRDKKVSFYVVNPTAAEDEAKNKEKTKLIRKLKRETGYTGRVLSIGEEVALEKLTDQLKGLLEYAPVRIIARGCFKKTVELKSPKGYSIALKIIDITNLSDRAKENLTRIGFEDPVEAFDKERERMLRIKLHNNPHISLPIGAAGIYAEPCYFFLEQYSEDNLLHYVMTNHPLDSDTVNSFALQLAEGIAVVHREGLYHGDIHPDNILINYLKGDEEEVLKLTDFDLCASMLGLDDNKKYLVPHSETRAPELYEGGNLDYGVDIWAFAVNAFFMRTGKMPFPKSFQGSPEDWEDLSEEERVSHRNHIYECIRDDNHYNGVIQVIDQSFEPARAGILKKCLERNPAKRFQNAVELYEALKVI